MTGAVASLVSVCLVQAVARGAKDEGAGTKGCGQSGRLDGSSDTTARGGTKLPSMEVRQFQGKFHPGS